MVSPRWLSRPLPLTVILQTHICTAISVHPHLFASRNLRTSQPPQQTPPRLAVLNLTRPTITHPAAACTSRDLSAIACRTADQWQKREPLYRPRLRVALATVCLCGLTGQFQGAHMAL